MYHYMKNDFMFAAFSIRLKIGFTLKHRIKYVISFDAVGKRWQFILAALFHEKKKKISMEI